MSRSCGSQTRAPQIGTLPIKELLDVLAEHVGLEIYCVANPPLLQRRYFIRVRDDPNPKALRRYSSHGKADAVDRYRTFEDNVTQHLARRSDVKNMVLPRAFPSDDFSRAIDVTGDEVPAEFPVSAKRAFEIDQRPGFNELKIGSTPRFLEEIEASDFEFATSDDLDGGEAATIHGKTVSHLQAAPGEMRANRQFDRFCGRPHAFDDSCFLYYSGEHKIVRVLVSRSQTGRQVVTNRRCF